MALKKTIAMFAMMAAPVIAGGGLMTDADAAPVTPMMPEVYAVDAAGHPLNDVAFSGTVYSRNPNALDWAGESLDDYSWTRMYGHSNTAGVSAGPHQSATNNGGFESSFPNQPTSATSCDDATMKMTINQVAAPAGYTSDAGSITVCQTAAAWIEGANTTNGGITFTPAPIDQVPKIVIHDAKGPGSGGDATAGVKMGSDGSSLPNVAKVQATAPQYGVPGMKWNTTLSYDSDGDGVKDTTVDVNTVEGLSTALTMGDQSYSDEIEGSVPWDFHDSAHATSCANSPAQLTVWETAAPKGYQKVDKAATLCLIGGSWVQTATPDDSTGWIKYDTNANLIRFGEYPAVPDTTPGHHHKPGKPGHTTPVVTVIPGKGHTPGSHGSHLPTTIPGAHHAIPGTSVHTAPTTAPRGGRAIVIGPKVSTDQGVGDTNGATDMEAAAGLLALAGVTVIGMKKARKQ